jgi:anti-sigma factor RsiW
MSMCEVQASGAIDLYFYRELPDRERTAIERHLEACSDCRRAVDELATIRAALASRPDIAAPEREDWSGFMARLDAAVQIERQQPETSQSAVATPAILTFRSRQTVVAFLAIAALLALVTIIVLSVARQRADAPATASAGLDSVQAVPVDASQSAGDAAFASLTGQHFERSKLVVLGLATKDPADVTASDWAYEQHLASALLSDTRLYRLVAEERDMKTLAGVMRDLELLLLQASMSEQPDSASLEQLQRLIRRRDLVTKMNVVSTAGS